MKHSENTVSTPNNEDVVADIVDEAMEREEALRNEAIRRVANQISAQTNLTGLCRVCGEPINPRRLAVMPTAQTCVECV
jgi:phage/conjugal plasmid C-4 type zinc finger TraR family protein